MLGVLTLFCFFCASYHTTIPYTVALVSFVHSANHSENFGDSFTYLFRVQSFNGQMMSLNTGIVTTLNFQRDVAFAISQLTMAHELGHNLGSPVSCITCS